MEANAAARLEELEASMQQLTEWAQSAHESIIDLEETSDAAASYDMVAELGNLQGLAYTEPAEEGEEDPEGKPFFALSKEQIRDTGRGTHWLPTSELKKLHDKLTHEAPPSSVFEVEESKGV
jgi:hypothetical protein